MRQTARLLRSILGQAVDDGRLARNAAAKVKQPSVRPRRQLFLTAAELGDLADECGEYGPLVWFLGWSGLRFGEAVALRAGRVDQKRPPGESRGGSDGSWRASRFRTAQDL